MISPLAYVDASAKLGANVTVHPFAYIDKNVEIGDDCEIMPHVSIMSGTRMGKRNRIFNGAVIAAEPQDFNYKGDDTIVEIGDDNVIRENVVINRATNSGGKTVIGNGNFLHEGLPHHSFYLICRQSNRRLDCNPYSFPDVRFLHNPIEVFHLHPIHSFHPIPSHRREITVKRTVLNTIHLMWKIRHSHCNPALN